MPLVRDDAVEARDLAGVAQSRRLQPLGLRTRLEDPQREAGDRRQTDVRGPEPVAVTCPERIRSLRVRESGAVPAREDWSRPRR
jgi:hypothetical protein